MIIPISIFVWTSILVKGTEGLYCLSCKDVPHPRDCRELKMCGSSEVCFDRQYVATSGRLTHELGCMDKLQCQGTVLTGRRRSGKRDALIICEQCCDSDFCQTTLCGGKDFVSPHGPVCYACETQTQDDCNKFQICGRDEVCIETMAKGPGFGDALMRSGCFGKAACNAYKSSIGKRSITKRNNCINCCTGFLCNNNCTMDVQTTVTTPLHTAEIKTTPIVSTTPHCVDATAPDVCKVAAPLVCKDRDKALNANCMHYCNFC